MSTSETCEACKYFLKERHAYGDVFSGICRIDHPTAGTPHKTFQWPGVYSNDWCGSYSHRVEANPDGSYVSREEDPE